MALLAGAPAFRGFWVLLRVLEPLELDLLLVLVVVLAVHALATVGAELPALEALAVLLQAAGLAAYATSFELRHDGGAVDDLGLLADGELVDELLEVLLRVGRFLPVADDLALVLFGLA